MENLWGWGLATCVAALLPLPTEPAVYLIIYPIRLPTRPMGFDVDSHPPLFTDSTCLPINEEGAGLVDLWWRTMKAADGPLSGVLADWLDDHRDHLLTGATGPDPAGRLDLLIHWLREVRCFGRDNVPAQ